MQDRIYCQDRSRYGTGPRADLITKKFLRTVLYIEQIPRTDRHAKQIFRTDLHIEKFLRQI
jgi:hypothetical protein